MSVRDIFIRFGSLSILLGLLILTACGAKKESPVVVADGSGIRLEEDLQRLESFRAAIQSMAEDMEMMRKTFTLKEKGHYTSVEHDQIEHLLFRYLMCRESLCEMVDFYQDYDKHFEAKSDQMRGFVIGYCAGLQLYEASARLVDTFHDEKQVKAKLNEPFHRTGIPAGTYDMLFDRVTLPENILKINAAWELFVEELNTKDSALNRLRADDPEYNKLIARIGKLHASMEKLRDKILEDSSLLLPNVRNALRHQAVVKKAQEGMAEFGSRLYAIRGFTFTNVSRVKNPVKKPLVFSKEQVEEMRQLLAPGDVILTFSEGYMSNIFLPGVFKHGITYVGSPEDRSKAGLTGKRFPIRGGSRQFKKNLKKARISGEHPADLVEAVAEGVIFNSLEKLAEYHFNRVAALRPRITPEQRVKQLTEVFQYMGCGYDFKFDFNDAAYQCCTEVIYRSLNGQEPFRFDLVKRMGIPTLSADDICQTMLLEEESPFELVFLAVKDEKQKGNHAVVLRGEEALAMLKSLFQETGEGKS